MSSGSESYICAACHGVVSCDRREAHDSMWCPALPDDEDDSGPGASAQAGAGKTRNVLNELVKSERAGKHGGARALLSPLCEEVTTVALTSLPSLVITLEQQDIWGPLDTGGALWYADRVMSEYLAFDCLASGRETDLPMPSRGLALVLGCGIAPLSGLVAAALGWDVVLTDLGDLLPLCQRNVDRNLEAIRGTLGRQESIKVMELPFGEDEPLTAALGAAGCDPNQPSGRALGQDAGKEGEAPPRLLVLCSDCLWQRVLHRLLLTTVAAALQRAASSGAYALVAWQARDPVGEASFVQLAETEYGLKIEPVDILEVLARVQWPAQVRKEFLAPGVDLSKQFLLYRLTISSRDH